MRWKFIDGKKVPHRLDGRFASSTNPETWTNFDEAFSSDFGEGLGFALGDGIGCYDLDGCLTERGDLEPWAEQVLERIPEKIFYMEISHSRRGIHVFVMAPESLGAVEAVGVHVGVERYTWGRYIAVTGRKFDLPPKAAEPDPTTGVEDAPGAPEAPEDPAVSAGTRSEPASYESKLDALAGLLWESLQEVEPDKRAALAKEYRSTLEKIQADTQAGSQWEENPFDELAARRRTRRDGTGRSGPATG
ncbi:hypothetical protein QDX25_07295 [Auritidibacter ignavus]|uniref:hypothetical protein n=1 Tax=Auritidibacter ignavus TaxID=678932 RepID=UPI0024483386|nr:hypothetical protein [Auritidibacter ignavus]WGH80613.1 hypothetical protein QDX25_07295 [Auritidibacter ignavus]